ncbi:peptidase inhibitor family I36 protein [Streptomyces sp. JNUCC 63]
MVLFAAAITGGATAQAQERPVLPVVAAADNRPDVRALSSDERQELQAEIDEVLAETDNGGVQISANEISWNGGEPILAFPLPGETEAPPSSAAALRAEGLSATADVEPLVNWQGCPAGNDDNRWYCFYQYSNFGGRRLQWNHAHCSTGIRFGDYGFDNMTTAWVNTTRNAANVGMIVTVYDGWFTGTLWREQPWTKVSKVDPFHDNKASSFTACRK